MRRIRLAVVAILIACAWFVFVRQRPAAPPGPTPSDGAHGVEAAKPTSDAETGAAAVARIRVAADAQARGDGATRSPAGGDRTFEQRLEALVVAALSVTAHVEAGRTADAKAADAEGRRAFDALRADFLDADERALFVRTGIRDGDESPDARARRRLCSLLIEAGLEDRERLRGADGRNRRLGVLVGAMLSVLPQDDGVAADLVPMLTVAGRLGPEHESAVLDFVAHAAAPGRRRLVELAADLLHALWRDLQRTHARSASELDALALLFQDDVNPAQRLAALRRLMTAADGRFRELAIQTAERLRDPDAAQSLVVVAAGELTVRDALAVAARLHPICGARATSAFVQLGMRDTALLRDAYEQRLAQNVDADFRAELVTGAAFGDPATGIAVADLAFRQDADEGVRARAMLALTGLAAASHGERALQLALDDERLARDPAWLGRCVLALENLARGGDPNAVDRVARRLRGSAHLAAADRSRLDDLIRRALPAEPR